jgi:hypothetical protein
LIVLTPIRVLGRIGLNAEKPNNILLLKIPILFQIHEHALDRVLLEPQKSLVNFRLHSQGVLQGLRHEVEVKAHHPSEKFCLILTKYGFCCKREILFETLQLFLHGVVPVESVELGHFTNHEATMVVVKAEAAIRHLETPCPPRIHHQEIVL